MQPVRCWLPGQSITLGQWPLHLRVPGATGTWCSTGRPGRCGRRTPTGSRSGSPSCRATGTWSSTGPARLYVWDSATDGNPGSRLVVQDDGNVVIYRPDGTPIWDTGTCDHRRAGGDESDDMQPGEVLVAGAAITSANGRYTFVYQTDGNLVLYGPGGALWASDTDGQPVGSAIMQGDGNLVIYGPGGLYVWDSATDGQPGSPAGRAGRRQRGHLPPRRHPDLGHRHLPAVKQPPVG